MPLSVLGQNRVALHQEIQHGVPTKTLRDIHRKIGIPIKDLLRVADVSRRTFDRRDRFDPAESDRVLRIQRIAELALQTFHRDAEDARAWLTSAQIALGDEVPFELVATEPGSREVEDLLFRIQHSVIS